MSGNDSVTGAWETKETKTQGNHSFRDNKKSQYKGKDNWIILSCSVLGVKRLLEMNLTKSKMRKGEF